MSLINTSKPNTSIANTSKVVNYESWDTNTSTWDNETRTWDEMASVWSNSDKPTTNFTNTNKP
jgi:hypothetical protein